MMLLNPTLALYFVLLHPLLGGVVTITQVVTASVAWLTAALLGAYVERHPPHGRRLL